MSSTMTYANGHCDERFLPLANRFDALLACGEEPGAGIAVIADGRVAVDLWGGTKNQTNGDPWQEDTLACCFSVTKGILSLLALRLVTLGLLDIDKTVASLWPDFAVEGKGKITVEDVLCHRAGLPAAAGHVRTGDLYNWDRMTRALAASPPVVSTDGPPVYHNMTYGYLLGEVLRRTGGQTLSDLVYTQLAQPLDSAFHIGLDNEANARCATISQEDPGGLFRATAAEPDSLFARSMAGFDTTETFNSDRWRRASIGSGNGHATARGIATIYDQLIAADGLIDRSLQRSIIKETGRSDGDDPILGIPVRYGTGFELSLPPSLDFGPNSETLGYWGAGGALGFADRSAGVAFGYVTRHMAPDLGCSSRGQALVASLYEALEG